MKCLVAVVGPTGSGKSDLGIRISRELEGEIVGCDALQIYKQFDIGTAKVAPGERGGIVHHLVDQVPPDEEFSAADYIKLAVPVIEDIARRTKLPVVVGGTGLYLRALRRGLFEGPGRSPEIRERLTRIAERRGTKRLHRILEHWDRASAERIHPNDRVRIIRALEVQLESGQPMSKLMGARQSPLAEFQVILVGLRLSREELEKRIGRRVEKMLARGFVDEVRALCREHGESLPAFKAIGYRETIDYLAGGLDEARLAKAITLATTQYAKRQMTWFRREEGVEWFGGSGDDASVQDAVLQYLEQELGLGRPGQNVETVHAETGL